MTIFDAYQARIDAGELTSDPVQVATLPILEKIRTTVPPPPKKSLFRKAPEPAPGLYMWGGVGRGKSMLMDLLYETIVEPKERWHFHAFMQWVHAEMAQVRKTGVDDALAPVAAKLAGRLRFLAFDEMQISDITDAMLVGRLFEGLFAAGIVIVTTSNRPPDDLYKDGLNRDLFLPFIAQIKERMIVHPLESNTDHRQGRLAGAQRYFSPADSKARAKLDSIWADLTQDQTDSLVLKVHGREVVLPDFHNGVARASFFDLCGKPLGAADYLALAQAVRVLLITQIPQLSRQNFNEAKRFVTLIDALYEAKVTLFASAAAQPEMLYVEGEGTFEFERTASRLREMQSADWG